MEESGVLQPERAGASNSQTIVFNKPVQIEPNAGENPDGHITLGKKIISKNKFNTILFPCAKYLFFQTEAQDLDFFGSNTPPQNKVKDFFSRTLEDMGLSQLSGRMSPVKERRNSEKKIDITALFRTRSGSNLNKEGNSSAPSSPSQQRKKEEEAVKADPVDVLLNKLPDLSFMVATSIVK
jgi:hypothetical protein